MSKLHPIQIEIYKKMTPEQKLRIAGQMNLDARKLKAAWLRKIHPDWSEADIQAEVKKIFMYAHT
ncbi:MAG: hypothetical protein KDE52_12520 [Calditrichaeota bacterium]|nr:hypothetical protein [Calditrichota bacterium]MCB9070622.1 hypothetical protein [Calditrichia bacterium]